MNSADSFLFIVLGSLLVAFEGVTMYRINDFFPQINGNLSEITWAHAVNNKSYLDQVLNDGSIMMIEADVSFGQLNNIGSLIPIMAHPPAKTSDLSMEQFIESVDAFNKIQQKNETRKGIKLDFKSTDVFQNAHEMIRPLYEKMKFPIWLNADIIRGPLNSLTEPVDKDVFLSNSKIYTNAVLSLGWTTNYGGVIKNAAYTNQQIQNMIDAVNSKQLLQEKLEVTFAVRAGITARSRTQMKTLRDNVTNCTLTVWSSDGDDVEVALLREVIFDFGLERVYVDVPKDLLEELDLGNPPKEPAPSSTPKVLIGDSNKNNDGNAGVAGKSGAGNVQPSVVVMLGALILAMALIKSLY